MVVLSKDDDEIDLRWIELIGVWKKVDNGESGNLAATTGTEVAAVTVSDLGIIRNAVLDMAEVIELA